MVIRGWNSTKEVDEILGNEAIPKMQFSKKMNSVVKEWHTSKKQKELDSITPSEPIIEDVN